MHGVRIDGSHHDLVTSSDPLLYQSDTAAPFCCWGDKRSSACVAENAMKAARYLSAPPFSFLEVSCSRESSPRRGRGVLWVRSSALRSSVSPLVPRATTSAPVPKSQAIHRPINPSSKPPSSWT